MLDERRRSYGYIAGEQRKNASTKIKIVRPQDSWGKFFLLPFRLIRFLIRLIIQIIRAPFRLLPKRAARSAVSFLAWGAFTLLLVGTSAGLVMAAWISRDLPDPNRLTELHIAESTKIYDRTGEHLLYEVVAEERPEKRTVVELEQIPKYLIDGVIATEDKSFFEHRGIRPLSMARSIVYGLIGKGRLGSGASTLTQQLVKNTLLTNERSYVRKIKEVILSIRLEQKYTKNQILKIYFIQRA